MDYDCVQSYWNAFEDELIKVVDKVAPLVQFVNSSIKQCPPISIKNRMNTRKRLLKAQKNHPSDNRRDRINPCKQAQCPEQQYLPGLVKSCIWGL